MAGLWMKFCGSLEDRALCRATCVMRALISGTYIVLIVAFLSLLTAQRRSNAINRIFNNRPPQHTIVALLGACVGIGYFVLVGFSLGHWRPGNWSKTHIDEIVAYTVQGLAWIVTSLTLTINATKVLQRITQLWWISMFAFCTCQVTLTLINLILYGFFSIEGCLILLSWPLCGLFLFFGFKKQNVIPDATLSEPFLGTHDVSSVNITPFAHAGIFSRMTFMWLNPLLAQGSKKPLNLSDLPRLAGPDLAETAHVSFTMAWNNQKTTTSKHSVFWALASCYWRSLGFNGACALLKCTTVSAGPLILNRFVKCANGEAAFKYEGLVLVAALFSAKMVESLSQRQWYFGSRRVGMQMRSAIIAAVYEKELKLSNVGRQSHAAGEILNYMAVDAYRIGEFPYWIHLLWTTPLQIFLALCILFISVGWATLAGLSVIILAVLLNSPLARLQQRYQSGLMEAQDERLRATSEALKSMKVLKLQAWEDHFKTSIDNLRRVELKWLSGVQFRKSLNSLIFWFSPVAVATSTFVACWLMGIPLTASNVFTALATLRIIQDPIRTVPDLIAVVVQVKVSLFRICRFLEEDELDKDAVCRNSRGNFDFALEIKNGFLSWDPKAAKPTIRNINLKVKHGEKVAVCGEVGSGKSTLLLSVLGEVPKLNGTIKLCGRVAYVAQIAWIECGTIRDNILFGLPMDKIRYNNTLKACTLDKDLESFPYRDLTEIGERGLNMSGGQKQRIQLARAIYQDADIYLLDDPFSAVDAHTAAALFKNCIMGMLSKKTVILVTHQVEFLPAFDIILLMQDGEIHQAGKYNQLLMEGSRFEELVDAHNDVMGTLREPARVEVTSGNIGGLLRKLSSKASHRELVLAPDAEQLTKEEEREVGDTGAKPYLDYLRQAHGVLYGSFAVLSQIIFLTGQLVSNWWLAAEIANPATSTAYLIEVYAIIGMGSASMLLVRAIFTVLTGLAASKSFFSETLSSLFHAPMSFFDSTPTGRILSRLSVDLSIVDVDIPFNFIFSIAASLNALTNLGVTTAVTWPILVVILPTIFINRKLQLFYLSSARELMRLNGTTKSPIVNFFGEAVSGAATIRAFGMEDRFMGRALHLVDANSSPFFHNFAASEWLVQRLEALAAMIVCSSALLMVSLPAGSIDPGFVGLAISYGLSLNLSMVFSIQNQCILANNIISVERIKQYMQLPCEAPAIVDEKRPPLHWPLKGKVELWNLQVRYQPGSPLVLHGITCVFEGGQRIGVVGRTGSGKSTLIAALFRLVEPVGGSILIDGLDITTIGLHDLRSRLSIIPQDPILFRGTVRYNVDPLCQHSDWEIWEALQRCQLADIVRGKEEQLNAYVGDDGENWSVGQRQLFCLGRVLLKHSRILVLDEATASIDNTTDAVLQKVLREEFSECTVITVAHRIPTVIDSDMVLTLRDGLAVEFDQPTKLLQSKTSLFSKLVAEYWANSQSSITSS